MRNRLCRPKEFDKEQLTKGLKEAGFAISRSFDRSMLERAEQELKRQYLTRGKRHVAITTTVTPLERNRVSVNFSIDEGVAAKIKQINIVGNQSFDEDDLLENFRRCKHRTGSVGIQRTTSIRSRSYQPISRLCALNYLNRGFLEFNVESTQVSISPDKKDIYIAINISEGERYLVSSIKLAGDLILPEEEFRLAMKIKPGRRVLRENLNESTKAISEKLSATGYAFAKRQCCAGTGQGEPESRIYCFCRSGSEDVRQTY